MIKLSEELFKKFTSLAHKVAGITIKDYKLYLVESRLSRFVGEGKEFGSYEDFYNALISGKDKNLNIQFIQSLTTNYTFFFREPIHFKFLQYYLYKYASSQSYLRFWSAGCSSGEEAYSIALTCLKTIPDIDSYDCKILASDISYDLLKFAQNGVFHHTKIKGEIDDKDLRNFFIYDPLKKQFIVKEIVKNIISFRYINLIDMPEFKKRFDIIFLRNVLIYFDEKEKTDILNNLYELLKPGGYIILGLSESLVGINHRFKTLKHSIYRKD